MKAKGDKKRLDVLVMEQGIAPSREKARALIMSGQVLVNGDLRDKAGALVSPESEIVLRHPPPPYVSRGGIKLAGALDAFGMDVSGLVCLDVGASTGGFTDCLLLRGAARVIALDVGYGQLAWKLRQDPRVTVMERFNARNLKPGDLDAQPDLAVMDVSFISLRLVVGPVQECLSASGRILCMVKPQFEVGKGEVGKKGVVRDPAKHQRVLGELSAFFTESGLKVEGPVPSPITGPEGNREFFFLLSRVPASTEFSS
ncbi:MAG: TlyA family RNA methyltransferase [Pseudomonadota bacterium]